MPTTSTDRLTLTQRQLDDVAWEFLRSEFTDDRYAQWPIDRRLDVFLRHRGHRRLHDDGTAYSALLERVMANLGKAAQQGILRSSNSGATP
ncbi:hypothetical protein [Mycobacterium sp. SMC-4]|uniref:hypothetical protein n=1 Tax=Mycobacterium sp. SMC-4 TaxID=2857059 RepID=UPI0021B24270|nr:hypothetical protein [Mycobacterium sp. SMC-4]UXA19000.1 hypothetical protein KXD98_04830 [Mycobacterium sp. SMC-4]